MSSNPRPASSSSASQRRRSLWGTRFGFYLAAIGSAFGLGNIWRFPYITVQNGGGAFVFLYVLIALGVGMPILIGELMLGKLTRRSVVRAVSLLEPQNKSFRWIKKVGIVSAIACLFTLSYYAVISGWVLHFLMQFFFGHIVAQLAGPLTVPLAAPLAGHLATGTYEAEQSLKILRESGWLQMGLTSVHLVMTIVIVAKGVQEGMEKWVGNAMPVFILLLVVLVTKSLSLPMASDAVRFMLYPDFTRLTAFSLLQALGHVLFTLSVGFGTMVTFGSYLNEQTHIPSAGFRVTSLDTVISVFAGLLIFPLLIGPAMPSANPELVFQALPRLLAGLDNGFLFGLAFFVCLYLAALGASIGMLEALVSNVLDVTKLNRTQAAWATGAAAFSLAILPALSTSVLKDFNLHGHGLLELLDSSLITCFLPLAALGISLAIAVGLKSALVEAEFVNDDSIATRKLYSHWVFVLKYLVPFVIVSAFAFAIWGLVRN